MENTPEEHKSATAQLIKEKASQQNTSGLAQLIRTGREQKNLTLEDVAKALKLPEEKLQYLETIDDLTKISAFDRGHLRNYAALLDLDLSPFEMNSDQVKDMQMTLKSVQQDDLNLDAAHKVKKLIWLAAVLVVALIGYWLVMALVDSSLVELVEPVVLGTLESQELQASDPRINL